MKRNNPSADGHRVKRYCVDNDDGQEVQTEQDNDKIRAGDILCGIGYFGQKFYGDIDFGDIDFTKIEFGDLKNFLVGKNFDDKFIAYVTQEKVIQNEFFDEWKKSHMNDMRSEWIKVVPHLYIFAANISLFTINSFNDIEECLRVHCLVIDEIVEIISGRVVFR
jgi:hypothetical protein